MDGQSQDYTQNADVPFQPAAQPSQQGNQQPQQQQQQSKRENQFQGLIDAYENELHGVDEATCPNIAMLVRNELFRLRGGVIDTVDVLTTKKTKVRTKVDIPVEAYPNVNFVGKLLGPAGKTLKTVQEQTNTKMSILGSGSLRNPDKEQELLNSGDPKYNHLRDRLHLQIDSIGNPSEAYYNISYALAEVKKVMIPDPSEQGGPGQMPMVTPLMGGGAGMGGANGGYGGMRNQQQMNQQRGGGRGRGNSGGGNRGSNRAPGGPPRINNFNPMFMNGANDPTGGGGFTDDYPTMGFDNSFESVRGGGGKMMRGGMDRMPRNAPYSRPM